MPNRINIRAQVILTRDGGSLQTVNSGLRTRDLQCGEDFTNGTMDVSNTLKRLVTSQAVSEMGYCFVTNLGASPVMIGQRSDVRNIHLPVARSSDTTDVSGSHDAFTSLPITVAGGGVIPRNLADGQELLLIALDQDVAFPDYLEGFIVYADGAQSIDMGSTQIIVRGDGFPPSVSELPVNMLIIITDGEHPRNQEIETDFPGSALPLTLHTDEFAMFRANDPIYVRTIEKDTQSKIEYYVFEREND